jgi:hypothetical protein
MRLATSLLIFALAGCVTQQLEISTQTISLPEANESVNWDPGKNDGNDIWPTGQGITTTQVMIKGAPDASDGPTFVAFVVWNGNFVGKIFRVHVGPPGVNFRQVVANINATRTYGLPDNSASSTGNGSTGGVTPLPHPNVDGNILFPPAYLINVKTNAAIIQNATANFMNFTGTTL